MKTVVLMVDIAKLLLNLRFFVYNLIISLKKIDTDVGSRSQVFSFYYVSSALF